MSFHSLSMETNFSVSGKPTIFIISVGLYLGSELPVPLMTSAFGMLGSFSCLIYPLFAAEEQ